MYTSVGQNEWDSYRIKSRLNFHYMFMHFKCVQFVETKYVKYVHVFHNRVTIVHLTRNCSSIVYLTKNRTTIDEFVHLTNNRGVIDEYVHVTAIVGRLMNLFIWLTIVRRFWHTKDSCIFICCGILKRKFVIV